MIREPLSHAIHSTRESLTEESLGFFVLNPLKSGAFVERSVVA